MIGFNQYTLFLLLALFSLFFISAIIVYVYFYRRSEAISALGWLMVAIGGWLIFNSLELAAGTGGATLLWARIAYPFIVLTPVAWFVFALQYAGGQRAVRWRQLLLLLLIPLLTVFFAVTNDSHHWLWEAYEFRPVGNMLALRVEHGPWFWIHIIYSYGLVFLGAFLISRYSFRSFYLYRQQSIWLIIGALIPVMTNLIYIFELLPALRKDYTPIAFALSGGAFAIGIFRYRLFDLQPVAREAMLDSMRDPMLSLDAQGRVVDLNRAASTLLEQPPEKVIGRPVADVLAPWPRLLEVYEKDLDELVEISITRAGRRFFYDMHLGRLSAHSGRAGGRIIVLRDVTERQLTEEALRQRTAELESRNAELDAFAHTVAHDLKGPLSVLTGYSDLLYTHRERLSAENTRHYLAALTRNGRKVVDIVDELLLLANVRSLEEIQRHPLATENLVDEAIRRLQELVEEKEAEIVLPEQWPLALGYGPWVEEVWVNYLSNALKYGGPTPRVELGSEKTEDGVRFWVRDEGPGIAAEDLPRLFQLFERLETAPADGHGLGLSIVRRIVERLEGEVGVESVPGEGSRFWFTLPAAPRKTGARGP